MALPDLEDHLAENGVDPALSSHLISGGWNSQNFSAIVDSKAGFISAHFPGRIQWCQPQPTLLIILCIH